MSNVVKIYPDLALEAEQLDLFGHAPAAYHKYSLLDISKFDQRNLFNTIANFETTTIIDTRILPVFRKPKFNINEIILFFENSQIDYMSIMESESNRHFLQTEKSMILARSVLKQMNIVLIYDNSSENHQAFKYKSFFDEKRYAQEALLSYCY